MASPTLVIADYPIGYGSGFGETLYNLFSGFPKGKLWTAHPGNISPAEDKNGVASINLPSPARPSWLPGQVSLAYYPFLKAHQSLAARQSVRLLAEAVRKHSIENILVVPVTPWILSAALTLHKQYPQLKLILYVMDDWQGHHECHQLPYSRARRRLLREVIDRAQVRFAVSREMAVHYEETYGSDWQVAHNGVRMGSLANHLDDGTRLRNVFLAGDVNVFRFDAVIAFAEAIERYNVRHGSRIEFTVMGEVAEQYRPALSALPAVRLLGRRPQLECLEAMKAADLLYLPLAFGKRSSRISLYSLPTKLPEYLASGKRVFFHAPKQSAAFRIAERYDLTPRLATINPDDLDAFLEAWKPNRARTINGTSRALAEEFDLDQHAARFQAAFV